MSEIRNWECKLGFSVIIFLILSILTLFSGCLEKPIDDVIQDKTKEISQGEIDSDDGGTNELEKLVEDNTAGEPNAPIVSKTAVITPIENQKTFTNSIGMEFVQIPAGEFDMGSPPNETGRWDAEGPVHHVKISNAFYMGKYEVTQKQWRDVMGTSPSCYKGDNLPVECINWNDVQNFVKKLNEKEGMDKYRLPSEAEWEYAERAGTTTRYSFGDNKSRLGDYAWYDANSGYITHEVGRKKPNPWGLYDMHGNVWEWVQDRWHGDYNGAPTDGSAWESGGDPDRVIRGGGGNYDARRLRSADRNDYGPGDDGENLGFRLLRVP